MGALGTTHYTSRQAKRVDRVSTHETPAELWSAADAFITPNRRVVLFAYDLALQLRISQGLVELPKLGWSLDSIVLERTAAWASFKHGRRSLMMCDLKSWSPVDFGKFVDDVGFGDAPKMVFQAGPDMQRERSLWRVGIIRESVLQILNWIEGENLGPFRPTGSGQSYAAFRRRFYRHSLLVHDEVDRLAAERAAMWTGRCEAWRHGPLSHGPYVEYDMQAAYCTIASECMVPACRDRRYQKISVRRLEALMSTHAVLAKIEVDTDVPCIPTRIGERTAWPVGTFRTWLWEPELKLALKHCNTVRVLEAFTYTRAPALRDFADWTLSGMGDQEQVYGLVPKRVLKHWSRCLVGRLGLRYRAWEKFATTTESDLRMVTYCDSEEGTITDMLIAGREWLILTDMQEAMESLPQIPSWVMSECRRRLWETMIGVGLDNVIYVDTDSIIVVDEVGALDLSELLETNGVEWPRKGTYSRMHIYGPRNYTAQDNRVVAGLPRTARQVAPLEFTGQVMRSIKESMRAGELDRVTELPRRFVLDAPDLRRQHLPGGRTAPFHVELQTKHEVEE